MKNFEIKRSIDGSQMFRLKAPGFRRSRGRPSPDAKSTRRRVSCVLAKAK
jgi:hypothetical protein